MKILTLNECQKLAESRNGKCLSEKYTNNKTKMLWECEKEHRWNGTFHDIKSGNWCPYCAGKYITVEDCIRYAKSKDGRCLSEEYTNNKTKMLWECKDRHQWQQNFGAIKNGNWCPYCAGVARFTLEGCQRLAINKGGKCLSKEYKNIVAIMAWECEKGHQWKTSFNNIKNQEQWCPYCSGIAPLTLEECQKLARNKGGKCLSKEYTNNKTKIPWECENGHQWEAKFNDIKSGHWCPECPLKTQTLLCSIIKELFPIAKIVQNYRGFKWLKNIRVQEIDIWVPKLKLAIEYDGEQHFKPVRFGGISLKKAKKLFQAQKKLDKNKDRLIKQHPEAIKYFIKFDYKEKITKENIIKKFKELGIELKDSGGSSNIKISINKKV